MLTEFQKKQAENKQKEREQQFEAELVDQEKILKLKEGQDLNFSSWAERCIKAYQEEGKDIKPLLKELKEYKKKVW